MRGQRRVRDDDRGVSEVVGTLLIVGLFAVLLGWYQATVVPAAVEETEFQHNERAQEDVVALEEAFVTAATTDARQSVAVDLGTRYESHSFFVTPRPPQGRLATVGVTDESVAVSVVGANGSVAGSDVADVWNGSNRTFNTGFVRYRPAYNRYTAAPVTVYDHSVVYNRDPTAGGVATLTEQQLVDGRRVSLVLLSGTYDAVGLTERVGVAPRSGGVQTVTVRNDSAPIRITVPTRLPNDTWARLLAPETVANGGHVLGQSYATTPDGPNRLTIRLEAGVTYELALGQVQLGETRRASANASYVVTERGDRASVREGGRQKIVVQVRDRFDNPVSGVSVDAVLSPPAGRVSFPSGDVTGVDGTVELLYEAPPNATTTVRVTVFFDDGAPARERTAATLFVGGGGSGSPGGPGPGPGYWGSPLYGSTVAFAESDELRTVDDDGVTEYQPDEVAGVGRVSSDIDGDDADEVPFVTSEGALKYADGSGNAKTLVGSGVATSQTRLGVGPWRAGGTSVFYVNASDGDYVYRAAVDRGGGATTERITDGQSATAIGGLGDIDGDRGNELVFGDSNSEVYYLDDDGSVVSTTFTSVGRNNGYGIGNPADFDGDGTARVPVVSGGNELLLVDASGGTEQLTSGGPATKSPLAAVDWDRDGEVEIVFVGTDGKLRYLDDVDGGGTIKEVRSGSVEADSDSGGA